MSIRPQNADEAQPMHAASSSAGTAAQPPANPSRAPASTPKPTQTPSPAPARRYGAALQAMLGEVPTDTELEALRIAADEARATAIEANKRLAQLREEIETARAATQPRPDLVETLAGLTAAEIEARVRALALPADHGQRMAAARSAIAQAEAKRMEAELLAPALEKLLPEIESEARRARDAASSASARYGTSACVRVAAERYLPAIAAALEAEGDIERLLEDHGGSAWVETTFLSLRTGSKFGRREVELEAGK